MGFARSQFFNLLAISDFMFTEKLTDYENLQIINFMIYFVTSLSLVEWRQRDRDGEREREKERERKRERERERERERNYIFPK